MLNRIKDFFSGRKKVKLHVEFNDSLKTQKQVADALHGYAVVNAVQKGEHTWKVDVRSKKDGADIVTDLAKRKSIRLVELAGSS